MVKQQLMERLVSRLSTRVQVGRDLIVMERRGYSVIVWCFGWGSPRYSAKALLEWDLLTDHTRAYLFAHVHT